MPKKRLTRSEQQAATRTRVLDAAERVFSKKGYHRASLEEIAAAAGHSKGAVYSNFTSKADLFLELMDRRARAEESHLAGEPGSGPASTASPQASLGWSLATLDFFLVAMGDPALRKRLAAGYSRTRERTGGLLEERGQAPSWATPAEFATVAMALGSGLIIQQALDAAAVSPDLYERALGHLSGSRR